MWERRLMKHVTTKNERDRLMIEALIFRYGQLSRAEIHELTHVQRSEISRMVRELLAEGRLLPSGLTMKTPWQPFWIFICSCGPAYVSPPCWIRDKRVSLANFLLSLTRR